MKSIVGDKEDSSRPSLSFAKLNYLKWAEGQQAAGLGKFGKLANVVITCEPYVVAKKPRNGPDGYIPEGEQAEGACSAADETLYRHEAIKNFVRQTNKVKEDEPALFSQLQESCDTDSLIKIKAHALWRPDLSDPVIFAKIAKETHHTAVAGTDANAKLEAKKQCRDKYVFLKQGKSESLAEFKKNYDQVLVTFKERGGDLYAVGTEEDQAYDFLTKLDPARYATVSAGIQNTGVPGAGVNAAYEKVMNFKIPNPRIAGSGLESTFFADNPEEPSTVTVTDAEVFWTARPTPPPPQEKEPDQSKSETPKPRRSSTEYRLPNGRKLPALLHPKKLCFRCGGFGHGASECGSKLANQEPTETGSTNLFTAIGETDDPDSEIMDAAAIASEVFCVAAGESADQSSAEEWDSVLAAHERIAKTPHSQSIFSGPVLVFDSAAGKSIFRDNNLLECVHAVQPWTMGGVNKTAPGLTITETGTFGGLHGVAVSPSCAANILAQGPLVDSGAGLEYKPFPVDEYHVIMPRDVGKPDPPVFVFSRKRGANGKKRAHYTCRLQSKAAFLGTVAENLKMYTAREQSEASSARELSRRLGHASTSATIATLKGGVLNTRVTPTTVRTAEDIYGPSLPTIKGATTQRKSVPAGAAAPAPQVQVQQIMHLDIFFIKRVGFLLGNILPLGYLVCTMIQDRSAPCIANAIRLFRSIAMRRNFDIREIRSDNEGGVQVMKQELAELGVTLESPSAGQHVPLAERPIRTVRERIRSHEHGLPFAMSRLLLVYCVLFCVSRLNFQAREHGTILSPYEQYSGRKPDAKIDLRCGFGDYVHATEPYTDNSMRARSQGCITLLPTGNLTGSVKMFVLRTHTVVSRTHFKALPMPDIVVDYLNDLAAQDGFARGDDPDLERVDPLIEPAPPIPAPEWQPLRPRPDIVQPDLNSVLGPAAGVDIQDGSAIGTPGPVDPTLGIRRSARFNRTSFDDTVTRGESVSSPVLPELDEELQEVPNPNQDPPDAIDPPPDDPSPPDAAPPLRYSGQGRVRKARIIQSMLAREANDCFLSSLQRERDARAKWHCQDFAFIMSVKAALRERGNEARPVMFKELKQMLDKRVWHGVSTRNLPAEQKRSIIRSSMFLKDKYLASGDFDKFKARLVAGGNQQDKTLYEDLSSPTVATTSVLTIAAIAATEGRIVETIDIGGAYLNADITLTGIPVHMRLDPVMATMLVEIDPGYKQFLEPSGCIVVRLDKALYGCVEASRLWYENISGHLRDYGFVANPYDACVFNKMKQGEKQITVTLHVDDLLVTCEDQRELDALDAFLNTVYSETKRCTGVRLDYLGMTLDFSVAGEVSVTMDNMVTDILSGAGVTTPRATPATADLFEVREAEKLNDEDRAFFHTHVAKLLYLSKRVRPECLTAVAFLTTRVKSPDIDDMAKLRRVIGYILGTRDRGITLRVGDFVSIQAFIDAAYGVHTSSGKSHTGCAVVLGCAGPVGVKSAKQKIVTKSSMEAELVGLSDTAAMAINLRNFIIAQGYSPGPAILFQDNMSCMALMKRGGPGSDKSRHISIRHFWLCDRVKSGEVKIEYLPTGKMYGNLLTKPLQGVQFVKEREALTNWTNTR